MIWKPDDECRAFAGRTLHRHVAAQQSAEVLGDGEPKARTAKAFRSRGFRLAEGLEQPVELFLRHADAGIRHAEADAGTALTRHRHSQRALARELVGVAQQVEQALFYLGLVGAKATNIGRADQFDDILTLVCQRLDNRTALLQAELGCLLPR